MTILNNPFKAISCNLNQLIKTQAVRIFFSPFLLLKAQKKTQKDDLLVFLGLSKRTIPGPASATDISLNHEAPGLLPGQNL